jgi:hypothetical protein
MVRVFDLSTLHVTSATGARCRLLSGTDVDATGGRQLLDATALHDDWRLSMEQGGWEVKPTCHADWGVCDLSATVQDDEVSLRFSLVNAGRNSARPFRVGYQILFSKAPRVDEGHSGPGGQLRLLHHVHWIPPGQSFSIADQTPAPARWAETPYLMVRIFNFEWLNGDPNLSNNVAEIKLTR